MTTIVILATSLPLLSTATISIVAGAPKLTISIFRTAPCILLLPSTLYFAGATVTLAVVLPSADENKTTAFALSGAGINVASPTITEDRDACNVNVTGADVGPANVGKGALVVVGSLVLVGATVVVVVVGA